MEVFKKLKKENKLKTNLDSLQKEILSDKGKLPHLKLVIEDINNLWGDEKNSNINLYLIKIIRICDEIIPIVSAEINYNNLDTYYDLKLQKKLSSLLDCMNKIDISFSDNTMQNSAVYKEIKKLNSDNNRSCYVDYEIAKRLAIKYKGQIKKDIYGKNMGINVNMLNESYSETLLKPTQEICKSLSKKLVDLKIISKNAINIDKDKNNKQNKCRDIMLAFNNNRQKLKSEKIDDKIKGCKEIIESLGENIPITGVKHLIGCSFKNTLNKLNNIKNYKESIDTLKLTIKLPQQNEKSKEKIRKQIKKLEDKIENIQKIQ